MLFMSMKEQSFQDLLKCLIKGLAVTIQCFKKCSQLSSWKWPVDELLYTCNVSDIVEILDKKPKLICGRTSEYFIERMLVYGWGN